MTQVQRILTRCAVSTF